MNTRAAQGCWPRTSSSMRSRAHGRSRRPSSTRRTVFAVARRRGTCAIHTWPIRWDALADHLSGPRAEKARIVVWAYNPHVGDSRATEAGGARESSRSARSSVSGIPATVSSRWVRPRSRSPSLRHLDRPMRCVLRICSAQLASFIDQAPNTGATISEPVWPPVRRSDSTSTILEPLRADCAL